MKCSRKLNRAALLPAAMASLALVAGPASASENGTSFYLLGSGGPSSAILPPLEGVFFDNTAFYYSGKAGRGKDLILNGNIAAGLDIDVAVDFATVLWVPTTNVGGGTLALGGTLAIGSPDVKADAILAGPFGNPLELSVQDDATVVGDPVVSAAVGWKIGKETNLAVQTMVNVPVGTYREGKLANMAFHRWAVDLSTALTWRDVDAGKGWDVSAKTGVTFNGRNDETDYDTGTEWHIEGAVERIFSPAWSLGLQAYHLNQLTGDSGSGALLGSFKGRTSAVGATAAHSFMIGKAPVTIRARYLEEFGVRNRPDGRSFFLSFTMPLKVKLPPGPPPAQ